MTRILVIEDEASLLENITELLESEGFEATGAKNGRVGIQQAQEISPDLIICDVLMPELDGYDVLSNLRSQPSTALIPFIFLTAKNTADDFRQGMNLGADDYVAKPFKRADLLKAIATRLNKQAAIVQLQQKIEELEKSNLLKDEFLETASDELRGSLTNIMMAIQMLRNTSNKENKERQQRYIALLQAECFREIDLINNLLSLQKLEANSRPLRLAPLNLQEWISVIVESVQNRAQERQQTIQISVPPYLPLLMLDCADLKQILEELLNNACKYTAPKGKITLEVHRAPQFITSDENSVAITSFVISNEAEIPSDALPKVFNKFYRVPGGDPWKQGGSGLGLTLVKRLVERVGGTIQVMSERGWTQFLIHLPAEIAP